MYRTFRYVIKPQNTLFNYCKNITHLSNNLYNASLFRIRQVLAVFKKDVPTPNEQEVLDEIRDALPKMNQLREEANTKRIAKAKEANKEPSVSKQFCMPNAEKHFLSYSFLDALMRVTQNQDYIADLPRHTAQATIKRARQDVKNYFSALNAFYKNPGKFKEKPQLPGYKKRGGHCLATLSNQESVIYGRYLKLPRTQEKLDLGPVIPDTAKLKEVQIHPYYGCFLIILVVDMQKGKREASDQSTRIAAIDFGVNNIAAIANNAGLPGLLFKGGIIKAENQWFNKRRSQIVHGITVGQPTTSCPTSKSLQRLSRHRDGLMRTEMHTIAKKIISWCQENNIDTLVLGHDPDWKDKAHMGPISNQNFVPIPFGKLRWYLTYMGHESGIRIVDQEESYTSKASFLDMDEIPTYGQEGPEKPKFSGYRKKRLYKSKGYKRIVNADLNGAGNILRKAFPDAFTDKTTYPFLDTIIVNR